MAELKLQIERRVDRLEEAVETMANWLVEAQTGFGKQDAEGIKKILRGEDGYPSDSQPEPSVTDKLEEKEHASEKSSTETMGVREDGEELGKESPLRQQGQTTEEE